MSTRKHTKRPPNILLITSDQQHWNTLGINNPEVQTPNLNQLAARGLVFRRAYCPNPTCTPTRASIITGKYPSQHGAWSLGTKLPETEPTVGKLFKNAGYRTGLVGKAHFQPTKGTKDFPSLEAYPILQDLDFWRKFREPFYGFEHVELARNHVDEPLVGQHYALWLEDKGCANWRDYFRPPTGNNKTQKWTWAIPEKYHYNTWIAERSNAFLEESARKKQPFFLWASFFDPHPPYLVPKPWDTMYDPQKLTVPSILKGEHKNNPPHFGMTQQKAPDFSGYQEPGGSSCHGFDSHLLDRKELAKDIAIYYGMISLMDKYIGNILHGLDKLGLAENTLVIFTSDHGHFFGQHGLTAKGPFHYEDMIRVPFIASWPGVIPAGGETDALQSLVDLAPTFLGLAGLAIPRTMTGVCQKDVWTGGRKSIRDHIIVENRHQPTTIHLKTYVDKRYKL
ncbi:MAG: sulfatase-like hydrolase/transferase, partial [Kiritimatiellia bacterium]|nr:sulfatase-like hydrolase/transferase [Kiritimatiellia bacterium]